MQVMTFLIENEEAALVVPARFLGQIHPHFREIQQVLAVTVADEARHIDVFTRRATITGHELALSTVGGRASLQTLLDEPDYATASFLLSVMGEGTFVSLLSFLERHAPDPLTRRIAHLTRNDEARHVAFSLAHLERHVQLEPEPPQPTRPSRRATPPRAPQHAPGSTTTSSTPSCSSPPATPHRPRSAPAGSTSKRSSTTWPRPARPASPASASPPAKPRHSPRSTPATSCDSVPIRLGRRRDTNPRQWLKDGVT